MNYIKYALIFLVLTSYSYAGVKGNERPSGINYLSPLPDAKLVKPENNIIIGFKSEIPISVPDILSCIKVTGSKSGIHNGSAIITANRKKIVFKSAEPFTIGETINVEITGTLQNFIDPGKNKYKYSFNTIARRIQGNTNDFQTEEQGGHYPESFNQHDPIILYNVTDLPQLTVTIDNNPADGDIFIAPYRNETYLTITTKNGIPYWYSTIQSAYDFKLQPNGNPTYFDNIKFKHYEMDGNYHIIDSFYCGNGYTTDIHELRVLGNGDAYVLAYDPEIVNMSQIVQGGDPAAEVVGLIIQEIDQNKNVIFQWRSWDHFAITDAWHENLLAHNIDAVHGNAIEIDNDSNLIISSRHLDEITKINRTTGDIMWRFGGKHNQFTFLGDTLKFTYQHAVRRIANGDITIFDNGNFHTPPHSRAVEYALDTTNKTATLVWQFRHNPDVFGSWGGYVQRLDGGNTLISWGGGTIAVTEVKPDGTTVFEAKYPLFVWTYRAYKFNWNGPPVSVNNHSKNIPRTFVLSQNYPNPFNPVTTIEFGLPKAGNVRIKIYDIMGREYPGVIFNQHLNAGSYKYSFDGSSLSSGVYFYRLIVDGAVIDAKKMVLLK